MKKIECLFSFLLCLVFLTANAQSPFKSGNVVVVRLGDGITSYDDQAAPVFLDEITPTGALVQSIALPTTDNGANFKITANYTRAVYGYLTQSANKQYLAFAGFNADPGTPASDLAISTRSRTIARIDYNGVVNTTTTLPGSDYGLGPSPVSAKTDDGSRFWTVHDGSTGGIRYSDLGTSVSTAIVTVSNIRTLNIEDNQLYCSSIGKPSIVSGGLPITGPQTVSPLPGFPNMSNGQSQQFYMADLNPGIAGFDVVYVANSAGFAITKYSLVGGIWTSNGTIGTAVDLYRAITGVVNGNSVTLYCTRKVDDISNTGGGELVTLTDNTGYSTDPGSFVGTPTVLKTAGPNTSYRGVAMAPQPLNVSLSTKIFLQGAYNSGLGQHKNVTPTWAGVLNASALNQPYNVAPFNYAGTESVTNGFFTSDDGNSNDVVDWVLVELHDATTPTTIIARKACFVLEDGRVVDLDKTSNPTFTGVGANNYYVVIRHRNHLQVRSATTVFVNGATPVTYDFTTSQSKAYQDPDWAATNPAMKDVNGVFCMWGGNVNMNARVNYIGLQNDALALLSILGADQVKILNNVYSPGDVNMDGKVNYIGLNNDALALLAILGADQVKIINEHKVAN